MTLGWRGRGIWCALRVTAVALVCTVGMLATVRDAWAARWSVQAGPATARSAGASLAGVSCVTTRSCLAVGSVAERWDGARWSLEPGGRRSGHLGAVDCASSVSCTAVGSFPVRKCEKTLAERWDGLSWMVDPTPTPPFWRCASYGGGNSVSTDVRLAGVSCRLGTTCMAVGVISSTDCGARDAVAIIATCAGADDPLVEVRTAGQWSIETTRLDQGPVNAVSCVSQVCTVVGEGEIGRFDDKRWSVVRAQARDGTFVELTGVSCVAVNACVAVGSVFLGGRLTPVVEGFNGKRWTIEHQINLVASADLTAVSCTSRDSCVAVGSRGDTKGLPLVERWNGRAWSLDRVDAPRGATNSYLTGLSCPAPRDCVAVGYYLTQGRVDVPLIESER